MRAIVLTLTLMLGATRARAQAPVSDSARGRAVADSGAAGNRRVPGGVWSYAARVESEVALALLQPDGREVVTQVEQTRNAVRWRRPGVYEQRVTAYRARSVGPNLSLLGTLRSAWTVPVLYGDRLAFFWNADSTRRPRAIARGERTPLRPPPATPTRDSIVSMHPLGTRRDRFYDYGGGDTVGTIAAGGRRLPVVRLRVRPKRGLTDRVVLFDGEIDLDATRWQIVRMRGSLIQYTPRRARPGLPGMRVEAMAYLELENAEVDGRAWLPSTQRFDFQIAAPLFGDARAVLRTVSHFRDYVMNDTAAPPDSLAPGELRPSRHVLVIGATDPDARWDASLGAATGAVSANDALDVAPDRWRPTGAPRVDFAPERVGDVVRYDRVEGLFTGVAGTALLRDRAPGVTVRASIGWAWAERAVRGRASVTRRRGVAELALRAGRSLDETNDFRPPLDSASAFAALLGIDDRDYVDRRSVSLGAARDVGTRGSVLRADVARVSDRGAFRHVRGGLVRPDTGFRDNRPVDAGDYWRSGLTMDYRPDVGGGYLTSGLGARARYERGDGPLRYQRIEAQLVGRESAGPLRFALRANGGALLGAGRPRQQLFEIGRESDFPGYGYKAFAGDRATLGRAEVAYALGRFTRPIRVGRWVLPGPAPAPFGGLQAAWTGVSNEAARTAVASLGTDATGRPLSAASGHVRRSVELGVQLFGSGLKLGVARALEPGARWRAVVRVGGP